MANLFTFVLYFLIIVTRNTVLRMSLRPCLSSAERGALIDSMSDMGWSNVCGSLPGGFVTPVERNSSFCKLNFYKKSINFRLSWQFFWDLLLRERQKSKKTFPSFLFQQAAQKGKAVFCSYRCAETTQSSNGYQPVIRDGLKMSVPIINTKREPLRAANPMHGNWNTGLGRIPFSSIKYLKGNNEGKEEHSN